MSNISRTDISNNIQWIDAIQIVGSDEPIANEVRSYSYAPGTVCLQLRANAPLVSSRTHNHNVKPRNLIMSAKLSIADCEAVIASLQAVLEDRKGEEK